MKSAFLFFFPFVIFSNSSLHLRKRADASWNHLLCNLSFLSKIEGFQGRSVSVTWVPSIIDSVTGPPNMTLLDLLDLTLFDLVNQ